MCMFSCGLLACAAKILTPNHFRALRGMPLIDVGERERTPRPSRRVALSNDTLRDPGRLRRSLHRCAARCPEVSFIFMYNSICVIIGKLINVCVVGVCVSDLGIWMHACICIYLCMVYSFMHEFVL